MTLSPKAQFKRWLSSPPRPHGAIIKDRTVSNLELFYDLVYVAVIAQASHHLTEHVSPVGFAEFAIGLYALVRSTVVPWTKRLLTLGPKAASGDASAAAEAAAIIGRLKTIGRVQLIVGALIILTMVMARFS